MANNDYGYFGKGTTGYAHYTQTHKQAFSGSNPSAISSSPTSSGGSPIASDSKPTAIGENHTVPTNDAAKQLKEQFFATLLILGIVYVLTSAFIIVGETYFCLQGWTTTIEFGNNIAGWVAAFVIALPCAICGFRHFFR